MYRRSDPRWNRTLQHISDNLEHANESAQENIYVFTQRYVNPCVSSISQCVAACTEPCFPGHARRRHHGRSRGRAEVNFDFYDDWEHDESDSLLGWGSDNLDRFLGGAANYGATAQPGRQSAMSYRQRNRDPRYHGPRRKSTAQARDAAQDSLSSRGDIFPSEDELEDAVPLDDEFAVKRGLAADHSTTAQAPMATVESPLSPLLPTPASEPEHGLADAPTMPDSCALYVDESDCPSKPLPPHRPSSLTAEPGEDGGHGGGFVPARLPNFGAG
ncbi:Zinc finger C2H2 [Pyrenophora seminiperda CCB06]|uniref:Zinc finger C2H2 n=1 Tax=Pyrenophora seminiperda CCB06 TaxID=1302712 RepID=A0A3M7MIA9_9PLEO|nr:Zinc finger C2H2 [Pyrenophora seminiperda CCB06]